MSQKNPIGWVEIPATDLDRAEKFYGELFGYEFKRQSENMGFTMSWFPMEESMDGYGSACTLLKGKGYIPSHEGPMIYFTAPGGGSLNEGMKKVEEMNIKVLTPAMAIDEHGFMAVIEDSEGNRIALHSMKA